MKKVVSDFIASYGLETGYSGSLRVLYIKKGARAQEALRAVREKWPTLAFYVRITEEIPAEAKEAPESFVPSKSVQIPLASSLKEELVNESGVANVVDSYAVSKEVKEIAKDNNIILKEATREEVDAYLIANPIDRTIKNPYDAAAEALGRTKEYIRDRYRKLRDKKLVEVTETTEA